MRMHHRLIPTVGSKLKNLTSMHLSFEETTIFSPGLSRPTGFLWSRMSASLRSFINSNFSKTSSNYLFTQLFKISFFRLKFVEFLES